MTKEVIAKERENIIQTELWEVIQKQLQPIPKQLELLKKQTEFVERNSSESTQNNPE